MTWEKASKGDKHILSMALNQHNCGMLQCSMQWDTLKKTNCLSRTVSTTYIPFPQVIIATICFLNELCMLRVIKLTTLYVLKFPVCCNCGIMTAIAESFKH